MRKALRSGLTAIGTLLVMAVVWALVVPNVLDVSTLTIAAPALTPQMIGTGLLFAGLVGGPVHGITYAELVRLSNPQMANEPQTIRHIFFDTETITTAVTTTLSYFTTARGDPTLTNLQTPGQMTSGQYFGICYCGFDILGGVSERADHTGILQDIQQIMLQQRPIWTLDYNSKLYGQYPLSFLHTSGGAVGGVSTGTADTIQFGNNGATDGGWNWGAGVVLGPSVGFSVTGRFAEAPTLTEGPLRARFWWEGVLARNVA